MKMTKLLSGLAMFAIIAMTLCITSCEEDNVKGCTDPESMNYDALATEDNGSCTYDKERFYGIYVGAFNCIEQPLLSGDEVEVEIIEDNYVTNDSVKIVFNIALPLSLDAHIDGDMLSVDGRIENIEFSGVLLDVNAVGQMTLSNNDNTIGGTIQLEAFFAGTPNLFNETDCDYSGNRQ